MSCKSWACSRCSFWKKSAAYRALLEGVEQALARDEWVRFFTLTAPAAGMTVREVYECFNRLRAALRRISKARPDPRLREYAAVLEWQERGEPHLHVIATGEFIPQAELSRLAAAAGFGPIADIRAVGGPGYAAGERAEDEDGMTAAEAAAWYLAKYLAKAEQEALTRAAADPEVSRVRPVRFSRRWGCSMSAAAALLRREWLESKGVDPDEPCEWVLLDVDAERGEVRAFNAGRRIGNMELLLLIDSLEYDRELGAELWRSWPERSVPRPPDPPPPKYEQQVLALGLRPTGGRTSPW